jgi:hypothetical protein
MLGDVVRNAGNDAAGEASHAPTWRRARDQSI